MCSSDILLNLPIDKRFIYVTTVTLRQSNSTYIHYLHKHYIDTYPLVDYMILVEDLTAEELTLLTLTCDSITKVKYETLSPYIRTNNVEWHYRD